MPRKYRLQALSGLFALAVLGCEQTVTDIVELPVKDVAGPVAVPFDGTAETIVSAVAVTATTTFTRTWSWTIAKSVDPTTATVLAGATTPLGYVVDLDATSTDQYAVSGTISFTAAAPAAVTVVAVTIGGTGVPSSCTPSLPVVLLAGPPVAFTCTFSAILPDG